MAKRFQHLCRPRSHGGQYRRSFACILFVLITIACAGCVPVSSLSTDYGRSAGTALSSVNGTSALAKLFRQSGKRVSVSRRLGDLVAAADVVVWVPDSYELPRRTVTRYFDAWLAEQPGRRLIYVVKDYDGAQEYWTQMAQTIPGDVAIQRELARAITSAEIVDSQLDASDSCDWFRVARSESRMPNVNGGSWAGLLEANGVRNPIAVTKTRLISADVVPDADIEQVASDRLVPLLSAGSELLVAEYHRNHWGDSKVVLFSSGSWLLNLPMIQAENRIVAEQLVSECAAARRVVFLETRQDGPKISDGKTRHHALEAFTVRPFNSILLHLTVLGMLFCCSVFPIFGRPRPVVEVVRSDFRKHVVALGELLARTGDTNYARARRDYYWTKVRRDSGASQVDEPTDDQQLGEAMSEGNPFAVQPIQKNTETGNA